MGRRRDTNTISRSNGILKAAQNGDPCRGGIISVMIWYNGEYRPIGIVAMLEKGTGNLSPIKIRVRTQREARCSRFAHGEMSYAG